MMRMMHQNAHDASQCALWTINTRMMPSPTAVRLGMVVTVPFNNFGREQPLPFVL